MVFKSGAVAVLRVVLSCLLVLGVAEGAARVASSRVPEQTEWGIDRYDAKVAHMRSVEAADVVFLGSSTVEVGIDPVLVLDGDERFSHGYNAALQAAPLRLTEAWAADVVVPELSPKRAVIGLASIDFNSQGFDHGDVADRYLGSRGHREAAALGRTPATVLSDWSALYRYRTVLRRPSNWSQIAGGAPTLAAAQFDGSGRDTSRDLIDYRVAPGDWARNTAQALNSYRSDTEETEALVRMVRRLQAGGVEVVLVSMPVLDDDLPMNPGYGEFDAFVVGLGEELGVPVLVPPDDVVVETHFGDPLHLNGAGTAELSTWLAGSLRAIA